SSASSANWPKPASPAQRAAARRGRRAPPPASLKPAEVLARRRAVVLRRSGFFGDAAHPLGGKAELHQRHAAVPSLAVIGDQPTGEAEPADALEIDRFSFMPGETRGKAEAKAGIPGFAIAQRFDKFPAIVAAGVVKALQHRCDRRTAAMEAEEQVVVDAVPGE